MKPVSLASGFARLTHLRPTALKCLSVLVGLLLVGLTACTQTAGPPHPVERHGHLSVVGNRIVNQHQKPAALAGPSLFWINRGWGGEAFYHRQSLAYVRDDWRASIVRLAIGVEDRGGYLEDPEGRSALIHQTIQDAIDLGLYIIVDWHSHKAHEHPEAAQHFFADIARRYGHHPNILYEIYNEPLADADWSTVVKPYAESVIAAIRAHDPRNLIIVGTPSWAQDVDKVADNPITGHTNIAYTLHFYAGSHGQELRDKATYALNKGIALVVTEWGTVNADGDGPVARESTLQWMRFLKKHQISHCNWAFNNKDEGASVFKPGTSAQGPWSNRDLTESGRLVKRLVRSW